METPAWESLRTSAEGDLVAAGVSAVAFVEDVLKNLPDQVKDAAQDAGKAQKEADQKQANADNLQELAEELQARADAIGDALGDGDDQDDADLEDLQAKISKLSSMSRDLTIEAQDAEVKAKLAAQEYSEAVDGQDAIVQNVLNQAALDSQSAGEDASAFCKGFSEAAGGAPGQLDPGMLHAAMEAFQHFPDLQDFAETLGWAKRVARAEWRKSPKGRTQMVGYKTQGLNLGKMASSEWAAMLSPAPAVKTDWLARAADGAIRHRHYEGDEKQGRGPVVVVIDESGSMGGPSIQAAKCLEWALLEICRRDSRPFYAIPFAGRNQFHVWTAPDKADPQGTLQHIKHFYSGGTEVYAPLTAGLDLIEDGDLEADVILITDANFGDPTGEFIQALAEAKARRPIRIETVLIGANGQQAAKFSDRITSVVNLMTDRDALVDVISAVV